VRVLCGFCGDVWPVTNFLVTLKTHATDSTTPPGGWRGAERLAQQLVGETPSTNVGDSSLRNDAGTLASDVDDIIANGFANSNGGANLQRDVGIVQSDADRVGCPRPN